MVDLCGCELTYRKHQPVGATRFFACVRLIACHEMDLVFFPVGLHCTLVGHFVTTDSLLVVIRWPSVVGRSLWLMDAAAMMCACSAAIDRLASMTAEAGDCFRRFILNFSFARGGAVAVKVGSTEGKHRHTNPVGRETHAHRDTNVQACGCEGYSVVCFVSGVMAASKPYRGWLSASPVFSRSR